MFVYFGFNIRHAAVAYFCVMIEQLTKFMTWWKELSYKIQKKISDFCFDISTKWRVKPNNISFSISFVVTDIFVWGVILQSLPIAGFCRAFWYISFDLLNMVSLDDKMEILFLMDMRICLRMLGGWFEFLWISNILLLGFW